jgi:hypothetical protein
VRDVVVFALLSLGFASFATAHLALSARLLRRERPRWKGLVGFAIPPLALLWGFRAGLRKNAVVWCAALVVYVGALILAKLTPD